MKEVAQSGNIGPDADHCRATSRLVTEEVERVARAIADRVPLNSGEFLAWDKRHKEEREPYLELATAAIEAMRASSAGGEVTDAMVEAGAKAYSQGAGMLHTERLRHAYTAMHALQSQPPSNAARLREALEDAKRAMRSVAERMRDINVCDCFARSSGECVCGAWDDAKAAHLASELEQSADDLSNEGNG